MGKVIKLLTVILGLAMFALPVQAYEQGTWIVRGGGGMVVPEDPSYSEPGLEIKVDDGTSFLINGTYMITPNWGFDILAALPFSHDIELNDGSGDVEFAEVKHLPPTFSFQYHFMPDAKFAPYVGLGLNYTLFFDEDVDQNILPGYDLSVDDTFGVAAQLGADYKINDRWIFHFGIRYIGIEPDVTLTDDLGDNFDTSLDINPMVYSLGFGHIFD